MLQKTILATMKEATSHLLELVPRDPYASARPSFLIRSVFLDRHNDGISFSIEEQPNGQYKLLDDGYYLSDFPEGDWQKLGKTLTQIYTVQVNPFTREISLICLPDRLPDALCSYFQAIVKAACYEGSLTTS